MGDLDIQQLPRRYRKRHTLIIIIAAVILLAITGLCIAVSRLVPCSQFHESSGVCWADRTLVAFWDYHPLPCDPRSYQYDAIYAGIDFDRKAWRPPGLSLSFSRYRPDTGSGARKEKGFWGFEYRYGSYQKCPGIHQRFTFLFVPLVKAFLCVTFCVIAIFGRSRIRSMFRTRRGLCVKCGYNLAELTEPRCPECGTRFNGTGNEHR